MDRLNDISQFRALFQAMSEGVIVFDSSGMITRFNESALKILDTTAEKLLGNSPYQKDCNCITEDLTDLDHEMHPAAIALKTGLQQKNRTLGFYKSSGDLRWVLMSATPIFYESKARPEEVLVTFSDITAQKLARGHLIQLQHEISLREKFLSTTLNAIPGLVSYLNQNKIYEYVNATYERWFGVAKSDVIGKSMIDILGPEAFHLLSPYVDGVLQGNRQRFRSMIPYKGAGERFVEVDYIPDVTPQGVQGFFAIINDISAQVLNQQKIEKQEVELRTILDALPALIGHWNKDMMNVHANISYAEYFGKRPEEIRGKHLMELLGKDLYLQNLPYVQKVLKGEVQIFERDIQMVNGQVRHTLANYLPEIENGKVIGFFVIVTDVTPIKDLLQKEQIARAAAEKAKTLRDEMVAVVSHDLRNPLSVAFTAAESVLRNGCLNPSQRKNIERIKAVNKVMLNMLNDLLDFNKMEAGYFSVTEDSVPIEVGGFLKDIIFLEEQLLREKNISLHVEVAPDLPQLKMNSLQISRVIQNLIGNSLKFTPEGGDIWLRARKERNGIIFEVQDSGEGIRPEMLSDIFNRFSQERKTAKFGSGLGLAIAKGIVKAHGGEIHAESEYGHGAKISFTIPFEAA